MAYDIRSFITEQLQSDRSIWNPKRMNKLIYAEFFTLSPKHFGIVTQAVIYIHWRTDASWIKIQTFKFSLTFRALLTSFRLENIKMTLLGQLLGDQCQSSMLEELISTFILLNNWRAVSSSSEFSIDLGRPLSSKHTRLEYWQLLQHFRSNETICSLSFELACLETQSSNCTFS